VPSRLLLGCLAAALAGTLVAGSGSLAGGSAPRGSDEPLYGIVAPQTAASQARLVRLDPRRLTPLRGAGLELGGFGVLQGRSPDGSSAVFVDFRQPKLRIVDLRRLRLRGEVALASDARWRVRAVAWLTADRLVALLQSSRGSYGSIVDERRLVLVDPLARRVLARRPFPDSSALLAAVPSGDKLVLLLGRADQKGPFARVATVDSSGRARAVGRIDRGGGSGRRNSVLVADPAGARAFVVTAGAPIVELDLATLTLRHHRVRGGGTFLARRGDSYRQALWIDERTLAAAVSTSSPTVVTGEPRARVLRSSTRRAGRLAASILPPETSPTQTGRCSSSACSRGGVRSRDGPARRARAAA